MTAQTLMIAGGGTGGHIYPAIAIAQEYLARPRDRSVIFVGSEYGLEKTIVPRAGYPIEFISVGGLKGKSRRETLRNLRLLPAGLVESWRLISRYRPAAILGVGGYSSGPVLLAGVLRGIPTMIHEANAYPGLTNRLLARVVRAVAVAYPEALDWMKRKGEVTGNPVRKEFFEVSGNKPASSHARLLVFGGSQGSRILNDNMIEALASLAPHRGSLEVIHQTGAHDHERVQQAYNSSPFAGSRVVPYLDRMWEEISAADMVISRSGAMTIGELCAVGRGSILVPFAAATNNHQEVNARVVERAGGAVVITEKELSGGRLARAVEEILAAPGRLAQMGQAARRLAVPDASTKIVEIIERIQRN